MNVEWEFELMRKEGFVVNIARGGIAESLEAAFARAVRKGSFEGVPTDSFEN